MLVMDQSPSVFLLIPLSGTPHPNKISTDSLGNSPSKGQVVCNIICNDRLCVTLCEITGCV